MFFHTLQYFRLHFQFELLYFVEIHKTKNNKIIILFFFYFEGLVFTSVPIFLSFFESYSGNSLGLKYR
jgi:hypothetical protein